MSHLLEVKNLKVQFKLDGRTVKAVDGVSFHVDAGEIVAIVGESGSGKSVTQYSILQLIPAPPGEIVEGEVLFEGTDLLKLDPRSQELRDVRGGKIGIIFQEPMTSLNPVMTVGRQLEESLILHLKLSRSQARERAIELLRRVGIPDAEHRVNYYPHQFSGGMRQRIMIAMAMSCEPKILIADEATTALDVTTQAQLLELLRDIVRSTNTALVLVTHNLGVVARFADRIYVMYAGGIVESGTCKDIFANPRHPYTVGLLRAIPRLDDPKDRKLVPIDGLPPDLSQKPTTCAFMPRCVYRTARCAQEPAPPLTPVGPGHEAACYVLPSAEEFSAAANAATAASETSAALAAPVQQKQTGETILEVRNLKMYFPVTKGLLKRKVSDIKAVDDVSFDIRRGETIGLVGESGCGKTTVARAILRMYDPTDGQIVFRGQDIAKLPKKDLRPLRRHMALVFQDSYSSLDPRLTAANIVGEPLKVNRLVASRAEYDRRIDELFELVGLRPELKHRYPHEFSGGQRQRLGIARALASNPDFIVCDEAISALDVSIQAQIINLLEELQAKLGLTYLFIAHDLSVVRHISDRVVVMYLGRVVEIADWKSLYENPKHPYTQALLAAVPIPDPFVEEQRERIIIQGDIPSVMNKPPGCSFSNRCPLATKECTEQVPPLTHVGDGHSVACIKVS
ncbi:MAG: ABC transporter ATP-binding protein [Alicyclobacillaceae bacterium]|nr:ABC transporter ATP-binding protein [Alicyclobacillaceae bacterium]